MAEFYEMPSISPTMEVGTLIEWRVAEGQTFESSAVVAEVGTDKANMEAEIFDAGVMLKHLIGEGDEVPPGFPIAIWGQEAGEDVSALVTEFEKRKADLASGAAAPPPAEPEPTAPAPEATAPAAPAVVPSGTVDRDWEGRAIHEQFMDPPGDIRFGGTSATAPASTGRVAASPLARKVAADLGVSLPSVRGTGPGGRITRADVESAPRGGGTRRTQVARADQVVRNSPMRKTIARRLLQSHTDIPTFFLTATFDMQGFVELRKGLKAHRPDDKVSYNDILIKAVAAALEEHPWVNASWGETEVTQHGRVDVGVAVAIDGGLITPVVRNANHKSVFEIATEVRDLAGRARKMKLTPEEYTGGTFTISNLGMMGIEHFTAIINPPESAILAVGGINRVPVVTDAGIETGWRMKVTMTCDHRVIDGAVGAAFLQTLRAYVEHPALINL